MKFFYLTLLLFTSPALALDADKTAAEPSSSLTDEKPASFRFMVMVLKGLQECEKKMTDEVVNDLNLKALFSPATFSALVKIEEDCEDCNGGQSLLGSFVPIPPPLQCSDMSSLTEEAPYNRTLKDGADILATMAMPTGEKKPAKPSTGTYSRFVDEGVLTTTYFPNGDVSFRLTSFQDSQSVIRSGLYSANGIPKSIYQMLEEQGGKSFVEMDFENKRFHGKTKGYDIQIQFSRKFVSPSTEPDALDANFSCEPDAKNKAIKMKVSTVNGADSMEVTFKYPESLFQNNGQGDH